MSRKTTASDRLSRLLALVPWVASHPEGAAVSEVCRRFEVSRAQLVKDLETVMMVGTYPFTPDTLIDAWIEDDRVMIHYADAFARPLRFTPGQAVSLLAALRGIQELPGAEEVGPLTGAIDKLRRMLGTDAVERFAVDLGHAPAGVFTTLEQGRREGRQVEIEYHRPGGEARRRRIEVLQIFFRSGYWYVSAWCHRATEVRIFRLDRILLAELSEDAVEHPEELGTTQVSFAESLPRVTLEVDRSVAWLFESVPIDERIEEPDGIRIRLAVASEDWLARLLVQCGPALRVVAEDAPLQLQAAVRTYAQAVLSRYGESAED